MASAPIKVGILGVGRGMSFVKSAPHCGMKLAAVCDRWETKLRPYREQLGVATYTDYDAFLEHEMDAVVLANHFHQHAPFAVKALEAGFHVLSEIGACGTLAEGVALARAVEKSGRIYMCGENVPYTPLVQEMKRLFDEGFVGRFLYGEGEYVHPMSVWHHNWLTPGFDHWRNWIPATYYCMHSLGPLLHVTGARTARVSGMLVPRVRDDPESALNPCRYDGVGLILCGMDNGAAVKLLQSFGAGGIGGGHHQFEVFGHRGIMETANDGSGRLLLRQEAWNTPDRTPCARAYVPEFPPGFAELARKTGHGGADFFVDYYFADAVRRGVPPFFDVYRGIEMSLVGILAYRSALAGGAPVEVPDFRQDSARRRYEADDWTPDPEKHKPGQPWPSMAGDLQPSETARRYAELVWQEQEQHWSGQPWKVYDRNFAVTAEYGPEHMQKLVQLKSLEHE